MPDRIPRQAYPLEAMLRPLDVIALRVEVDTWEAGTLATVLEVGEDTVLAEVTGESGSSLDIVTVPVDAAEGVPWHPEASPSVSRWPSV